MTRRHHVSGAFALVLASTLASACGGDDASSSSTATFPVDPLVTVTSQQGKLRLAAWTSPEQPPSRGTLTVRLLVTDVATGAPVDGLTLDISPEMPSMGHGTPVVPKVRASGNGVYLASDVSLFMAGAWDLRTNVQGAVTDTAIVSIDAR